MRVCIESDLASSSDRVFSILFRCDGSEQVGLGHISRCLGLAKELHERYGCRISFAIRQNALATSMVAEEGFVVVALSPKASPREQGTWLQRVCRCLQVDMVILDIRDDLPRRAIQQLRQEGIFLATIDDPTDRRLDVDWAFYPPVPQVHRLDWTEFTGNVRVGWEWVLLRPEFSAPFSTPVHQDHRVLVTMGGTDPLRLTEKIVMALDAFGEWCAVTVVLGRGYGEERALQELLHAARGNFEIRRDVKNMSVLMEQVDLAIASFGVTAYELAAKGVPCLYCCLTSDHVESAMMFDANGLGKSLGLSARVTVPQLQNEILGLLHDRQKRIQMSECGRRAVDGRGAGRIADVLITGLKEHHESIQAVATT